MGECTPHHHGPSPAQKNEQQQKIQQTPRLTGTMVRSLHIGSQSNITKTRNDTSINSLYVGIPKGRQDLALDVKELFLQNDRLWKYIKLTNVGSLLEHFIESLMTSHIELLIVEHEPTVFISDEEEENPSDDVGGRNLSNEDDVHFWPVFGRALGVQTSLYKLHFGHVYFSQQRAQLISQGLAHATANTITELQFDCTDFFEDSHVTIAEMIRDSCPNISSLIFNFCWLKDEKMSHFLRVLVGNPTLRTLECRSSFSSKAMTVLAQMIRHGNNVLETLVLFEVSELEPVLLDALCHRNCRLLNLTIESPRMTSDTFEKFACRVGEMTTLQHIHVATREPFSAKCITDSLLPGLEKNMELEEIMMRCYHVRSTMQLVWHYCDLNRAGRRYLKRDITHPTNATTAQEGASGTRKMTKTKKYPVSLWPLIFHRLLHDMKLPQRRHVTRREMIDEGHDGKAMGDDSSKSKERKEKSSEGGAGLRRRISALYHLLINGAMVECCLASIDNTANDNLKGNDDDDDKNGGNIQKEDGTAGTKRKRTTEN